jgi:hypothetical protein
MVIKPTWGLPRDLREAKLTQAAPASESEIVAHTSVRPPRPAYQFSGAFDTCPAIEELCSHRQWLVWDYAWLADKAKWTKPPMHPRGGYKCSATDPKNYARFAIAAATAARLRLAGVGFALTRGDDLTGIDLDNCRDPETGELAPWAAEIVALGETYWEVSPSGTGLRGIARGKIDKVLKCDPAHVEIYAEGRYLTITGQRVPDAPDTIGEAPRTIEALRARAEAIRLRKEITPALMPSKALPARARPQEITPGTGFFRNVNDAALANLGKFVPAIFGARAKFQPGTGAWRVSSRDLGRQLEEDLSLAPSGIQDFGEEVALTAIDVAMLWGNQPGPVEAALWICETIEVHRDDLGFQDFDKDAAALAELGAEISRQLTAAGPAAPPSATNDADDIGDGHDVETFPERLTYPPGFLGDLTDWITDTARYPSRPMALATALAVLGTTMGREWCGPTDSSTVLYALVLAPTGGGKDHAVEQVQRLLTRAGVADLIGPDDFQSANAMANFVQRTPLSLCVMDEFGAFLQRITHKNASSFARDTSAFLRKMWSTKFKLWRSSEYAQRASVPVWAPSFNLLGVSVPKEFYAALRGQDVSNGFFNRFFIISAGAKPAEREPLLPPIEVPAWIAGKLTFAFSRGRLHDDKRNPDREITPTKVQWGAGGKEADDDLKFEIAKRIEGDEAAEDFYTRCREMAIRIATIAGYGQDMTTPVVDGPTMTWAGHVALWATEQMFQQFQRYAAETETQALAKEILRHVQVAKKTESGARLAHSQLLKKLAHRFKAQEVKGAIELLIGAGDMVMEQGAKGANGRAPIYYRA